MWALTHAHTAGPRFRLRRPTCSPMTQTLLFPFLKPTTSGSTKCELSGAACIWNCVCLCTKIASELVINTPYSWSFHEALLRAKMVLLITGVNEEAWLMLVLVLAIQMKTIVVWEGGGSFVGRAQLLPLLCRQKWAKLSCFKTLKGNNKKIVWRNLFFWYFNAHVKVMKLWKKKKMFH